MKKTAPTTRSLLDILTRNLDDTEEIGDKLELRFLDSLKFTQSSLDALASNLGNDQFKTLNAEMKQFGKNKIELFETQRRK